MLLFLRNILIGKTRFIPRVQYRSYGKFSNGDDCLLIRKVRRLILDQIKRLSETGNLIRTFHPDLLSDVSSMRIHGRFGNVILPGNFF